MTVAILVAVLAAALLHAIWNALAHNISDTLAGFVLIGLADTICCAVLIVFAPLPAPASWPYLLISVLLEVGYQVLLLQAYRLGEFGQVYPLARGTSPWLVAIIATTVLGQPLPPRELAGILVISVGLICLAVLPAQARRAGLRGLPAQARRAGLRDMPAQARRAGLRGASGSPRRTHLPALGAAVGTGVMIALYTVVDGVGVRHAGTVLGYVSWLFLLQAPVLPLFALARYRGALAARLRPVLWRGLLGGVLSLAAYGLVVWAQSRGALAPIAALRETSIVIAAIIATVVFRERFGLVRLAASVAVVAGIVLLNL